MPREGFNRLLTRRKAADQTVNNSTTLVNDTHLVFNAGRDEAWFARYLLLTNSSAVADVKFQLVLPAGATARVLYVGNNDAGTLAEQEVAQAVNITVQGTGANRLIVLEAHIVMSTTAGDIQLQWAQNTAEASNTRVLKQSMLIAERVI